MKNKTYKCQVCKESVEIKNFRGRPTVAFINGKKVCEACYFEIKSKNNGGTYFNKQKKREECKLYIY